MTLPVIPKISLTEIAAEQASKAAESVVNIEKQLAEQTAQLSKLKESGDSLSAGAAAVRAAEAAALEKTIESTKQSLAAANNLLQLQKDKLNFSLIDDIELPDINLELPSITAADILGMLPPLPAPPDFPPKLSISLKTLLIPAIGLGSPPGLPAIPGPILALLKLPPKGGNVSGPGGSFAAGTNITQNVIATDTVIAPSVSVGDILTSPTIVTGNIASTTTINLAAAAGFTITSPTVLLTSPAVTMTGSITAATGIFASVAAPFKLFDIPHPSKENQRLRHGCLEGPELGVYTRGKTSEGIIPLPSYWSGLVDEKTITVHLTPTNMDQTLVVNNINGLLIQVLGNHHLPYHYMVMAERKDVDKLDVETNV
jgi:hypothetical protein